MNTTKAVAFYKSNIILTAQVNLRRLISGGAGNGASQQQLVNCSNYMVLKRFYSPQPIKRFYDRVKVSEAADDSPSKSEAPPTYEIKLDEKKLRTPARNVFQVDNPGLAYTIGAEWAAQKNTLAQASMHLTALSNTSQDNPTRKTKYDLSNEIINQLTYDTIIYRTEVESSEQKQLWELQQELWDPVLYWFQDEFSIKLPIVSGTILAPSIPEESLVSLRNYILSHSFEAVQGLVFSCNTLRSVILPIAVAKNRLRADEAVRLSRLELEFQNQRWGRVEWAHDIEYWDTLMRTSAGMMFYDFHAKIPYITVQEIPDKKSIS